MIYLLHLTEMEYSYNDIKSKTKWTAAPEIYNASK